MAEFDYDSGYESDGARIAHRDVIAGDYDDLPLDQLINGLDQ